MYLCVDDCSHNAWCGAQGRLDDQQLMLYMLQNDIALQASLDCYRNNYMDCTIEMKARKSDAVGDEKSAAIAQPSETEAEIQRQLLEHLQVFLFEVTTSYLVLGFVVFRFCKMPAQPNTLVPVAVPIGDIEWSYEGTDDGQELLRIPAIDIPRDLSGRDTRYYVYKFRSNGQYFSGDASGVLCRLTKSYRRLVLARDHDLIIRNENLRKTVFVEQNVKQDTSVLNQGTRASEYGELQAIMDYTRGRKETTHSVTPPTKSEELKASISVSKTRRFAANMCDDTRRTWLLSDTCRMCAATTPQRNVGARNRIHRAAAKRGSKTHCLHFRQRGRAIPQAILRGRAQRGTAHASARFRKQRKYQCH